MNTTEFQTFFDYCVGSWVTERTYHYLTHEEVERSRTEFTVTPLSNALKTKVLQDNQYSSYPTLDNLPGFSLEFYTISEKGEEVTQQLNLLFVPKSENNGYLTGDYLRDRAYEEARPIVSQFRFEKATRELLMTTYYTRVVSVDSITLINPSLRLRKILNYQRPEAEQALLNVILVGFGVEKKLGNG